MATSLQKQLAAIAANSTHQLDLKAQKAGHSKSLLFDPRQAASQSFDTIYQICIEGFDELCLLDSRYAPFSRTLFSEQSKNEDRTSMTAQENRELDDVIERFLGLLTSKLLLAPAVKAAEWLVRRFKSHEYNTSLMLFAFLPYHSTPVFNTLMSIVPEKLPQIFRFLHPYKVSVQVPPRHAIVAAMGSSSALLSSFSQFVLGVAKVGNHSAMLIGFWASLIAQAVNVMVDGTRAGAGSLRLQREEDMLLKVLPILQSAMNIRDAPELYLACCMIITILVTRGSLQDKVMDAMMEEVVVGWSESTLEDGITCLSIIAEEKDRVALPKRVRKCLMNRKDLLELMERTSQNCRVDNILIGISLALLHEITHDQAFSTLKALLSSKSLSNNALQTIMKSVTDAAYTSLEAEPLDQRQREVIRLLEELVVSGNPHAVLTRRLIEAAQTEGSHSGKHLAILSGDDFSRRTASPAPADVSEEALPSDNNIHVDISKLPQLMDSTVSFLSPNMDATFVPYAECFQHIQEGNADYAGLIKLASTSDPSIGGSFDCITFLARLWCANDNGPVRLQALKLAITQLNVLKSAFPLVDLQGLLPYAIKALSDSSRAVRKAAVKFCQILRTMYQNQPSEGSSNAESLVWRRDTLYGLRSSQIRWLQTDEVRFLLDEILAPVFDDCVLDNQCVLRSLTEKINVTHISKSKRKSLDSSPTSNLPAFLASHAVLTPVAAIRLCLFELLENVGKAATFARIEILIPFSSTALKSTLEKSAPLLSLAEQKVILNNLSHRSVEEFGLLQRLADGTVQTTDDIQTLAFKRLRSVWKDVKEASQIELADWLLSLALDPQCGDVTSAEAMATIRNVSLSTQVQAYLLSGLPKASEMSDAPTPSKKQRLNKSTDLSSSAKMDDLKVKTAIRRITLVLELVDESKPEQHPQLMKDLFRMLTEIHHYKALMGSELIYLQGLVLNSLLSIINGLETASLPEIDRTVVRADLIVECARTTAGTPVHHTALLLMSALASRFPSLVLHSVMPLFTFMSSSIMKQSDEYSARVTERTVASVIPPLAASLRKRGKDLVTGSSELLLSFVAAFEHIPLHRRSSLFKHLVQTLGPEDSLFAILAMLIERYTDDPRAIPFAQELLNGFTTVVQLQTTKQYLQLVSDTLLTKRGLSNAVLGYNDKTPDEAKAATSNLLHGLASLLSGGTLQRKLIKDLKSGTDMVRNIRSVYTELLEMGMQFKLRLDADSELQSGTDRVLGALLSLMPTKDFIESSAMLMQSGTDEIRQQVFRSLESRVSQAGQHSNESSIFIDVLPNCVVFLTNSQPVATRYAAVTCIDEISGTFGKTDRAAVFEAAQHVAGDAALGSNDPELRVMSLLCLASMVEVLEDQILPILPPTLNTAIGYLENEVCAKQPHATEALANATYGFASAVLDYVPWIMSGEYLDRMIRVSEEILTHGLLASDVPEAFCALVAQKATTKDCLDAILKNWSTVAASEVAAAKLRLSMLGDMIKRQSKAEVGKHAQLVFQILLTAFDFRRTASSRISGQDDEIDLAAFAAATNAIAMDVVLKSNDATFRPFFIRLVEWASSGLPSKDRHGSLLRAQSLYSFANTFFDQLKSLVTSYSGLLLDHATSLLQTLDITQPTDLALLTLVIETLTSSFRHDQDTFWQSPARFDAISSPLLQLLIRSSAIPSLNDPVIVAITELAAAASSQDHFKSLNTALMAALRHANPSTRLAAVKCQRAISARLNLDWIALLPEMLPVISELQEDDDVRVEQETLRWVQQIEAITGESMEGMLQ